MPFQFLELGASNDVNLFASKCFQVVFETLISRLKMLVCGLMWITLVLINLKSCSKCNFRNCEPFGNFYAMF